MEKPTDADVRIHYKNLPPDFNGLVWFWCAGITVWLINPSWIGVAVVAAGAAVWTGAKLVELGSVELWDVVEDDEDEPT